MRWVLGLVAGVSFFFSWMLWLLDLEMASRFLAVGVVISLTFVVWVLADQWEKYRLK